MLKLTRSVFPAIFLLSQPFAPAFAAGHFADDPGAAQDPRQASLREAGEDLTSHYYALARDEDDFSNHDDVLIEGLENIISEVYGDHHDHSDTDLADAFYLSLDVAITIGHGPALEHAANLLEMLEVRGAASRAQVKHLFDALIGLHRFDEAEAFRAAWRDYELPALSIQAEAPAAGASGRYVYRPATNGSSTLDTLALDNFSGAVVIATPACRFANAAAAAILGDPDLAEYFTERSIWVVPPVHPLDDPRLGEWNADYPSLPLNVAYQHGDWPEVNSWASPTFYVFEDGQVVAKRVGWPLGETEENLARLRSAIPERRER